MTPSGIHALASVHAVVAWSATAALVAAAILRFASRSRAAWIARARAAAALGTALLTATVALGFALDASYARELRQRLFIRSPLLGWLFERKEHLAVAAALFAWSGAAALVLRTQRARRAVRAEADLDAALATIALRGYAGALLFAVVALVLSVVVGRTVHF